MPVDDMKQDATVTLNWFRMNVPTIIVIIGLGFYVGTNMTALQHSVDSLKSDSASLKSTTADMNNLVYRVDQLESGLVETNRNVNHLKDTIISGQDLMRRDINRLTTQVEVLSSRFGIFIGDVDEPKQRRARPAPPSID